jgi:flavin reductase (DIM6/NTAB) family NADH-FMN oxidoreductase RutF
MMTFGREFRDALSLFTTGVAVVTTVRDDGVRFGKTISSFNSVSLDPPLILFSIACMAQTLSVWQSAHRYAVNILNESQGATSTRFARANTVKWDGMSEPIGGVGAIRIPNALACFECEPYAEYEGGDHAIFVGRVLSFDITVAAVPRPLVFYRSRYRQLDTTKIDTPIEADMWLHGW